MGNCRGFTAAEMLVAMTLFLVVVAMGSYAFQRVLEISGQQTKSAETSVEGLAGLELMRYDLEHAGYGLPWRFQNYTGTILFRNTGAANAEIKVAAGGAASGFDPNQLNAVASTNIRAFAAGSATKEVDGSKVKNGAGGPDYLVVRSTVGSLTETGRRWSYLRYSSSFGSNVSTLKRAGAGENFTANDRIISMRLIFGPTTVKDKILLMNGNEFEVALPATLDLPAGFAFKPADPTQIVIAYGVRNSASASLRMPYYRIDYFVSRPLTGLPPYCNPGTGLLYRGVIDQASGLFERRDPVLDCVGDLQVEFDYDENDDGNVTQLPPELFTPHSASEIRDRLKTVRVYALAHEGKKDPNFSYPQDSIQVGDSRRTSSGRTLSGSEMTAVFGTEWKQYRWKVYTLVVRPKNLIQ